MDQNTTEPISLPVEVEESVTSSSESSPGVQRFSTHVPRTTTSRYSPTAVDAIATQMESPQFDDSISVVVFGSKATPESSAKKFIVWLADKFSVSQSAMLQSVTEFAITQGTSLRMADDVGFLCMYIENSEVKRLKVTVLDIKEALSVCGIDHFRRVMRYYADYARRLLQYKPGLRPIGLVRCPNLFGYRHLLFDFCDGCTKPHLTPLEMSVVESYRLVVLARYPQDADPQWQASSLPLRSSNQ